MAHRILKKSPGFKDYHDEIRLSNGVKLSVVAGDIVVSEANAFVSMLSEYLICGSLGTKMRKVAGADLTSDFDEQLMRCGTGQVSQVFTTRGGNLNCQYVFHVVTPLVPSDWTKDSLRQTFLNIIDAAEKQKIKVLACPDVTQGHESMAQQLFEALANFPSIRYLEEFRFMDLNKKKVVATGKKFSTLKKQSDIKHGKIYARRGSEDILRKPDPANRSGNHDNTKRKSMPNFRSPPATSSARSAAANLNLQHGNESSHHGNTAGNRKSTPGYTNSSHAASSATSVSADPDRLYTASKTTAVATGSGNGSHHHSLGYNGGNGSASTNTDQFHSVSHLQNPTYGKSGSHQSHGRHMAGGASYDQEFMSLPIDPASVVNSRHASHPASTATVFKPVGYRYGNVNILIHQCDITTLRLDAIVSSANSHLRHANGLAKKIGEVGGPQLLAECQEIIKRYGALPCSHVVVTRGGGLPVDHVIHALGPRWPLDNNAEAEQRCLENLKTTFKNILMRIEQKQIRTIAIPPISSGQWSVPIYMVARVMCSTILRNMSAFPHLVEVHFVDLIPSNLDHINRFLWQNFLTQGLIELSPSELKSCLDCAKTTPAGLRHQLETDSGASSANSQNPNTMWGVVSKGLSKVKDTIFSTKQTPSPNTSQMVPNGASQSGVGLAYDGSHRSSSQHSTSSKSVLPTSSYAGTVSYSHVLHAQNSSASGYLDNGGLLVHGSGARPKQPPSSNPAFYLSRSSTANNRSSSPGSSVDYDRREETEMDTSEPLSQAGDNTRSEPEKTVASSSAEGDPRPKEDKKEEEMCVICMSECDNPKKLSKCEHVFCTDCIDHMFKNYEPKCPSCGTMYGVKKGNQPKGHMDVQYSSHHLPGHERYGMITIHYSFPSGTQTQEHQNPGQHYTGTSRTAYLPKSPEGEQVLALLRRAFDEKLLFTIGRSVTTGADNVVTWNDVHHKTSTHGGPTAFGYPDPTYLNRVREELAAKGIV